jgi:hypothetical protein
MHVTMTPHVAEQGVVMVLLTDQIQLVLDKDVVRVIIAQVHLIHIHIL